MGPAICKKWWKVSLETNSECVCQRVSLYQSHGWTCTNTHAQLPYGISRCSAGGEMFMLYSICHMILCNQGSGKIYWKILQKIKQLILLMGRENEAHCQTSCSVHAYCNAVLKSWSITFCLDLVVSYFFHNLTSRLTCLIVIMKKKGKSE